MVEIPIIIILVDIIGLLAMHLSLEALVVLLLFL